MLRHVHFPTVRRYLVEISGWDTAHNFFVEKCDLVWSEDAGKQVLLKRTLRDNAILFVRLLQACEADRSHPVVFEAEHLGETHGGLQQFRLNQVVPRVKREESSGA